MNKTDGGDGIPAISNPKWWCCQSATLSISANNRKHSSGHRTRKGPVSFLSQRRAMPKNAQTTVNRITHFITVNSFHTLAKQCSEFSKLGFNSTWTKKFQMFKLALKKAEEPDSNYQHPLDHRKGKRIPEKYLLLPHSLCERLWLCGSQQTVGNSYLDGNTRSPYHLLRNLYARQEATVRTERGTMDCF